MPSDQTTGKQSEGRPEDGVREDRVTPSLNEPTSTGTQMGSGFILSHSLRTYQVKSLPSSPLDISHKL